MNLSLNSEQNRTDMNSFNLHSTSLPGRSASNTAVLHRESILFGSVGMVLDIRGLAVNEKVSQLII